MAWISIKKEEPCTHSIRINYPDTKRCICDYCGELIETKPTNADRIRNMSDEELAEKLSEIQWKLQMTSGEWIDWLKQEVMP